MARSKRLADFRLEIETLREHCPTLYPVVVRRVSTTSDRYGDCTLKKSKGKPHFYVRIDKKLAYKMQVWVLIHEWAHCMVWDERHEDHGPHFGICYSSAYSAIFP
jgi:hypothetical protein